MRGHELRSFVRTDKLWFAVFHQQRVQSLQNILHIHFGPQGHVERFTGIFIQNRQHSIAARIAKLTVNKVGGSNVVEVCEPQPDNGAIFMIKPFVLLVPRR